MNENPSINRSEPLAEISNLQRYLRTLSYRYPEISPPPVDGIFERATTESLKAFQAFVGLPVTGSADRATWEALYAAYLDTLFNASLPTPLPVFPSFPPDFAVKPNDTGFLVSTIQYLLTELGTLYDFPLTVNIDGIYGSETVEAIRYFQKLCLLPQTGETDKHTWNYLVGAYMAEDASREQT